MRTILFTIALTFCMATTLPHTQAFATHKNATEKKEESPLTVEGATTVTAEQAKALFDEGALFIDVRKISDWESGRIPDAVHLELKSAFTKESLSEEAAHDEPIIVYCNGPLCPRSAQASELAVEWGFTNIQYFREGYPAWQKLDYPIE